MERSLINLAIICTLYCWDSSVAYSYIINKQNMDIKYFSPTIKSIRQKCHLAVTDLGEPPAPPPPNLGEKEEEIREGGKAARASKEKLPPPPPNSSFGSATV